MQNWKNSKKDHCFKVGSGHNVIDIKTRSWSYISGLARWYFFFPFRYIPTYMIGLWFVRACVRRAAGHVTVETVEIKSDLWHQPRTYKYSTNLATFQSAEISLLGQSNLWPLDFSVRLVLRFFPDLCCLLGGLLSFFDWPLNWGSRFLSGPKLINCEIQPSSLSLDF